METTASNFPGVFTVDTSARGEKGLQGKDAVLIDLASGRAQTATEGLRQQLLSDRVLQEGQDGIKATMAAECNLAKEVLISRFEAKESQREVEEKIRLDGEKTRDILRAQDTQRLLDQIAALRADNARLLGLVPAAPVTLR